MHKILLEKEDLTLSATLYGGGEREKPLVVCLHGFPDNANSFRHQIDDLTSAGYQVLCPTLRGYETASVPESGNFSISAIALDIIDFLDQMEVKTVHLIGHDWGSVVAYYLGSHHADRLKSLVTIAIANPARFADEGISKVPSQLLKSWYMGFNQLPLIANKMTAFNDYAYIKYLWRKWSPDFELTDEHWADLRSTFCQQGVVDAMLGYYRQNVSFLQLLGIKESAMKLRAQVDVPNLAITGGKRRLYGHPSIRPCSIGRRSPTRLKT